MSTVVVNELNKEYFTTKKSFVHISVILFIEYQKSRSD